MASSKIHNIRYKRIVVKVGTSTLTYDNGELHLRNIERLVSVLSDIKNGGTEVILVSSGAIGVGVSRLKMPYRPAELKLKQAAAAVGQCRLMHLYDKMFAEYSKIVAQILLTREDVDGGEREDNLISTFNALLELNAIPIVNENDSVSSNEIQNAHGFGDNDTLSAVVAELCNADLLVLLSDIEGLYTGNPRTDKNAALIKRVDEINNDIIAVAGGAGSSRGTGGMHTKIEAAKIATENGIDMIITNGAHPERLYDIMDGKEVGTYFAAKKMEQSTK